MFFDKQSDSGDVASYCSTETSPSDVEQWESSDDFDECNDCVAYPQVSFDQAVDKAVSLTSQDAASKALAWRPQEFQNLGTLQEAPRNSGLVLLMRSLRNGGQPVAVKKMPNAWVRSGPKDFKSVHQDSHECPWNDIGVTRYLHAVGYKHICEPLGVFRDSASTYVVSSFATQGDLYTWMCAGPTPGYEREAQMRPIVRQVFEAVHHLHKHGIAHLDLSVENIVLTADPQSPEPVVKLIDFGMASTTGRATVVAGKRSYIAPELHKQRVPDCDAFLCDSFSIGVAVFALACASYPWDMTKTGYCRKYDYVAQHGLRQYLSRRKASATDDSKLSDVLSEPLIELLEGLLAFEPEARVCFHSGDKLGENVEQVEACAYSGLTVWDFDWSKSC